MDARFERALARWPNVPALFGWLRLTRRGHWLIRDEFITNQRVNDVINRNYDCDEHGRWYFQNGPQRGYVALDYAPFVFFAQTDGNLLTHTGLPVTQTDNVRLDEAGGVILDTEHGPGILDDHDLEWVLERLRAADGSVEDALAAALAQPDGTRTSLVLQTPNGVREIQRCDADTLPTAFGFVRDPESIAGESGP